MAAVIYPRVLLISLRKPNKRKRCSEEKAKMIFTVYCSRERSWIRD
jgi:hypothetical protein